MKLTEGIIQKALFNKYSQTSLLIPNIYWRHGKYEMDMLRITGSGVTYEYEIKVSRADFKSEFKNKEFKHRAIGGPWDDSKYRANHYYFVCPDGMVELYEVPDPCGLLVVTDSLDVECRKRSKKLHDERVKGCGCEYNKLARNLMYKLFNHGAKFNNSCD